MIQNNCPTLQTSPDYIMMIASLQQAKQPVKEVRGILPDKRKMSCGWPKVFEEITPKDCIPEQ